MMFFNNPTIIITTNNIIIIIMMAENSYNLAARFAKTWLSFFLGAELEYNSQPLLNISIAM